MISSKSWGLNWDTIYHEKRLTGSSFKQFLFIFCPRFVLEIRFHYTIVWVWMSPLIKKTLSIFWAPICPGKGWTSPFFNKLRPKLGYWISWYTVAQFRSHFIKKWACSPFWACSSLWACSSFWQNGGHKVDQVLFISGLIHTQSRKAADSAKFWHFFDFLGAGYVIKDNEWAQFSGLILPYMGNNQELIVLSRGGSRIFSRGGGGGGWRILKKFSKILTTFFFRSTK